jgi:hypothetical protein
VCGLELKGSVADGLITELKLVILCRWCDHLILFFVVSIVFLQNAVSTLINFRLLVRLQKLNFIETYKRKRMSQ